MTDEQLISNIKILVNYVNEMYDKDYTLDEFIQALGYNVVLDELTSQIEFLRKA